MRSHEKNFDELRHATGPPAEYSIDPSNIGKSLGLTSLHAVAHPEQVSAQTLQF
jgi:hypothetical protein